jgi:hypothetical protein
MVTFTECDPPASAREIDELESRLCFKIPAALRELLMSHNGGRPTANVFKDQFGSTDVSECLALRSGKGSLEWAYDLLIRQRKVAPLHYLPFAVDSGGNTFLVDCAGSKPEIHLLLHDPEFRLFALHTSLEEFWGNLEPREMRNSKQSTLVGAVRKVVEFLVGGDFEGAERLTRGVRLSADAIKGAVHDYGGTLVFPPATAFDDVDVIGIADSEPPRWSIRFDLWTEEEGRSDLSIEMTIRESPEGAQIELDNIHVL